MKAIVVQAEGITMKEAFRNAQKDAIYHYGNDPYNGQINNCDLGRDVTNDFEFVLAVSRDKIESAEIEFQKKWLDKTTNQEVVGYRKEKTIYVFVGWAPE